MAIRFKACPRCGGDIDTTYRDDMYCVQCAHRPPAAGSTTRRAGETAGLIGIARALRGDRGGGIAREPVAAKGEDHGPGCPKCGRSEAVRLDKIRPRDHTCYRCRLCGHVFSPAVPVEAPGQEVLPW